MPIQRILDLPLGSSVLTGSELVYAYDPSLPTGSQDVRIPISQIVGGVTEVNLGSVSGTVELDFSQGTHFSATITGPTTFTGSNVQSVASWILGVESGGAYAATFSGFTELAQPVGFVSGHVLGTARGSTAFITGVNAEAATFASGAWNPGSYALDTTIDPHAEIICAAFVRDPQVFYTMTLNTTNTIHRYTMPSDYAVGSYTLHSSFAHGITSGHQFWMHPDETHFIVVDYPNGDLEWYTMTTPGDVSTGSHLASVAGGFGGNTLIGAFISADGTRMWATHYTAHTIRQWDLSTPFDPTTKGTPVDSTALSEIFGDLTSIFVSYDGRYLCATDRGGEQIEIYELATPNDVTGDRTHLGAIAAASSAGTWGCGFSLDGEHLLYCNWNADLRYWKI